MTPQEAKKQIGAEFYTTMKDGETPQIYYKFKEIKYNDGSKSNVLHYRSSFGIWQPSSLTEKARIKLIKIL